MMTFFGIVRLLFPVIFEQAKNLSLLNVTAFEATATQLIDELSLLGSLTVGGVGLLDATEVGLGSLFGVICDAYGGVGLLVVVVLDVGLSFFRDFPFSVYHIPMLFSNI